MMLHSPERRGTAHALMPGFASKRAECDALIKRADQMRRVVASSSSPSKYIFRTWLNDGSSGAA
jgi:hypothetical protein